MLVKLKVHLPSKGKHKGDVVDVPPGTAARWFRVGNAEPVDGDEAVEVEETEVETVDDDAGDETEEEEAEEADSDSDDDDEDEDFFTTS